ncbi:MAG: phage tail protein, partial [Clostridia bacterium]|nr:phage tail protein [Clostridia bacterium]
IRSFVELYNAKGSAGIFRVNLPEESFGSGERISLEHGICTLDDATVRGRGEISGTPRGVLARILEHQTTKARGQNLWTVGTVEAPDNMTIKMEHDGTKTLEMLSRFAGALEGYRLGFDQSGFPWKVNVIKKQDKAACEGRLSRNIRTIRKTIDDSDLCTRLICSLLDDGYIESDTIGVWGAVEQEITLNDGTPKEDVIAYCRKYLENRKNPALAVEMDADEWFTMTGERMDRIEIGDICRLALPEYGVVIEERIVALHYMDALGKPEAVTVSLANQVADLSIRTAEMKSEIDGLQSTSTSYGNRISTSETKITNLKDTQEGIEELNGKMTHWFNSVEIDLDAEEATIGLLASRTETYDLFQDVDQKITDVGIELDAMDAELLLYAKQTTVDNLEKEVYIRLDAAEEELELKADKITLNGYVTANQLEAEISDLNLSMSETIVTNYLTVKSRATLDALALDGNNIKLESTDYVKSVGRTKRYVKSPADVTVEIWEISSISNGTLDYLSY